jgi:hypothetical protein
MKCRLSQRVAGINCVLEVPSLLLDINITGQAYKEDKNIILNLDKLAYTVTNNSQVDKKTGTCSRPTNYWSSIYLQTIKKNFNSTINVSLLSKKCCQYVRIMLVFVIR